MKQKIKVLILLILFPILFICVLTSPPWIREEREIVEHGVSIIRKNIGFISIFEPPSEFPNYRDPYRISHSIDYIQWITLLSGIVFINASFYQLTKSNSNPK